LLTLEGGVKYQIRCCLGVGGFARVFKAYIDNNSDDVVALKVILVSIFNFISRVHKHCL